MCRSGEGPGFRDIVPGFETLDPSFARPRHAHLAAYASIILQSGYDQASYAGRMRLRPGDVILQPSLDRHESLPLFGRPLKVLRLAWKWDSGFGGVMRLPDIDHVIRTAENDPREAAGLLESQANDAQLLPRTAFDWPDLLAKDLQFAGETLSHWAQRHGMSRETVSRGFSRAFGVSPSTFRIEIRTRAAWSKVVTGMDSLAGIAAETGFADQAHMTRSVAVLTGMTPAVWRRANLFAPVAS